MCINTPTPLTTADHRANKRPALQLLTRSSLLCVHHPNLFMCIQINMCHTEETTGWMLQSVRAKEWCSTWKETTWFHWLAHKPCRAGTALRFTTISTPVFAIYKCFKCMWHKPQINLIYLFIYLLSRKVVLFFFIWLSLKNICHIPFQPIMRRVLLVSEQVTWPIKSCLPQWKWQKSNLTVHPCIWEAT